MDPEVSLMLHCDPSQALEEHQMHVEVSDRFNRQRFPEIEQHIEAIWTDRVTKEPWLFNGAKFRLHSALLTLTENGPMAEHALQNTTHLRHDEGEHSESALKSPEGLAKSKQPCVVKLQLGLTCYKDYLGTNWSREAEKLQSHGRNECLDPQAFLSQPLGVGAVLATADGDVVLLRRSQKVAEAAGLLDIPGGHPEPKMVCPGVSEEDICVELLQGKERAVVSEIFSSVCAEISDEVNVPVSSLSKPLFMGIALNHTSAGRPSAEFYVRCTLTTEEVRDFYRRGGPEANESTDILFLSRAKMLQLNERSPLWSEMCPSAKGAVLLYQRVMPE
ncbi:uridine diphosphate glucose pyrophosphatase NUDT22 [Danio rerio]|uniref:Nudix (Nucleoside diphosphate linked moiety X)-type motif 22 n=1 Tax=Danio rerio TaxID=7955 RepID=Q5XJP5_DANRE|nr:uridine diphosphate glucose pyrophosphatase NUDT22 [Danio rerio]AAH83253.1 Nudix (nucleoside diphosphate linked moiety X)-type motif 22 [Danio rerio]|eukprot:NP_001006069.1 nucleoside diphosphate-linked moiety X motif 22 [Danio rerio]